MTTEKLATVTQFPKKPKTFAEELKEAGIRVHSGNQPSSVSDQVASALETNAAVHAPAPLPVGRTLRMVNLADLRPSPTNPRTTFAGIDELAKSLEVAGMIVPLIVREVKGVPGFELVAGERRLRAAKKAKLDAVPCDVRELDDTQVFEVQIIENSKRSDLTDLEQAEMFEALETRHGYSVEQISEKFTVSVGTVYSRLKLLALCAEARTALSESVLPPSVAVPMARLPTHALQAKALKEMKSRFINEDADGKRSPINAREAIVWIQREFSRTLKNAPFKLADAMLLEGVGACHGCPKNTATATPGLFEDFAKGTGQTCTDVLCFKLKADAAWKAVAAAAKKDGAEVLSRDDGAELYKHSDQLGHGSKYVELDTPNHADPKKRSWREFFERLPDDQRPKMIVAPDRNLVRHDLADAGALLKAIAASPGAPKWSKEEEKAKAEKADLRAEDRENRAKAELRERVVVAAFGKLADSIKVLDLALLRFIIAGVTEGWIPQPTLDALECKDRDAFDVLLKRADLKMLHRILFLIAVEKGDASRCDDGYTDEVKALTKAHGIDLKEIEKAIANGDAAEALMTKPAKKGTAK
jgi:ParB/RepB/Spo0J family partition protein